MHSKVTSTIPPCCTIPLNRKITQKLRPKIVKKLFADEPTANSTHDVNSVDAMFEQMEKKMAQFIEQRYEILEVIKELNNPPSKKPTQRRPYSL
jgi:hypothetical protein